MPVYDSYRDNEFVSSNTALIVDHDIEARKSLSGMLDRIGCETIAANDGLAALDTVNCSDVSIVLCDWDAPGMSGIELCTELRCRANGRYIYFILISRRSEREVMFAGLAAGADDYICKPVDNYELAVKIKSAFRIVNLERQLAEKNQRLQKDYATVTENLLIAGQIQLDLLPAHYCDCSVRAGWLFKPAQYVSGDMLDYFDIGERYWVFFVMDVEGHGIPSALTVFSVNNQLKPTEGGLCASVLGSSASIAEACTRTIAELNQRTVHNGRYFTMVYGILDRSTGKVTMTQAGHPPPLHLSKATGELTPIGDGGMPVGLLEEASFSAINCQLAPGDRLFIHTDGVTECEDKTAKRYGTGRLIEQLKKFENLSPPDLCEQVGQDLCLWNGDKTFNDDVSLLVIEYESVNVE